MWGLQRKGARPAAVADAGPTRPSQAPAPRADHLPRPSQRPLLDRALHSRGEPLDGSARPSLEAQLGHDFAGVRVHTGPEAAESAEELHAAAFTVGSHVVFGAGRYRPGSSEGRALLAHELAHVVQQAGGAGTPRPAPSESRLEQQASDAARGVERPAMPAAAASGLVQRQVLPVQRFSPSAGIVVDRTDRFISIMGRLELYGPEGSVANAATIQSTINTTWTHAFPDGYAVNCNITVTYRGPGSSPGAATQIQAVKIAGPSHVTGGEGSREMTLNANEPDAFTWTPAHEFGHIIGLRDRYSESIMSSVRGRWGGTRTATTEAGYGSNLMGVTGGELESRNLADVAAENQPSPYWINDDDEIREWVSAHRIADITALSTGNKLAAIRTLMSGWISDEDVSAIVRICSSVTDHAQADAIRSGIDLSVMSSYGQRGTVRMAFRRMP